MFDNGAGGEICMTETTGFRFLEEERIEVAARNNGAAICAFARAQFLARDIHHCFANTLDNLNSLLPTTAPPCSKRQF